MTMVQSLESPQSCVLATDRFDHVIRPKGIILIFKELLLRDLVGTHLNRQPLSVLLDSTSSVGFIRKRALWITRQFSKPLSLVVPADAFVLHDGSLPSLSPSAL